jgi:hypothetical protein
MGDCDTIDTTGIRFYEQARGTLGISLVTFRHDGTIVATVDGVEVPVSLPSGWQCQALPGGAIVYRCPCGALVMGAAVHRTSVACEGKCPECFDAGPPDDNGQCFKCGEPKAPPRMGR